MFIHELFEQRVVLGEDIIVYKNPTHSELKTLVQNFGSLRGMCDTENGPLYVWDAHANVHHTMHKYLGHHEVYLFFNDYGNTNNKRQNQLDTYSEWNSSQFVRYTKHDSIYCAIKYDELKKPTPNMIAPMNLHFKKAFYGNTIVESSSEFWGKRMLVVYS